MMAKKLEVGLGTLQQAAAEFLDVAKAVQRGEKPRARERLYFADMATLLRTLTPERWRLLAYVSELGPLSVQAVARGLGRNYKNVHGDVQRLCELGLLEKSEAGIE